MDWAVLALYPAKSFDVVRRALTGLWVCGAGFPLAVVWEMVGKCGCGLWVWWIAGCGAVPLKPGLWRISQALWPI